MIEYLQKIGLSEKEAKVYHVLSQFDGLTASTIAKRTGIKRASIYDVLHGLEKKNLIHTYKKKGNTYFFIDSVDQLVIQKENQLRIAQKVAEDLKSQQKNADIQFELHRDREGFSSLYRKILLSGSGEFISWSNFNAFDQIIDLNDDAKWTKKRINNGTRPRLIMIDNPVSQKFKKEDEKSFRKTHLISSEKNFSSTLVINEDDVYVFDNQPEVSAIKIQHRGLATILTEVFNTHWRNLEN